MKKNAQDSYHKKQADTNRNRPNQNRVGYGGHLVGKHLEIRLRYGDNNPHKETDQHDQNHPLALDNAAADTLSQGRHGHLRTQLEKAHSHNQLSCPCKEKGKRTDLHRNKGNAQQQHNDRDGKNTGERLPDFFFEFFVHNSHKAPFAARDSLTYPSSLLCPAHQYLHKLQLNPIISLCLFRSQFF